MEDQTTYGEPSNTIEFNSKEENTALLIADIKRFRQRVDALINYATKIKTSAETTLAWRSLQMAKGWMGKALGALGTENPYYKADKVQDIPPTADVCDDSTQEQIQYGLAGVNYMRDRIKESIQENVKLRAFLMEKQIAYPDGWNHPLESFIHCYQHLEEASMWYGFELQRLRETAGEPIDGDAIAKQEHERSQNNGE